MRQIVISNSNDVIDIRDVIERFEELEADDNLLDSEKDEFESLKNLLSECRGNGGDEQWQGDWYPITLIRDSYFKDYAEELAEDIGAIDKDASWPRNCIDWNQAARELQMDYTGVEFDEVLYWVR